MPPPSPSPERAKVADFYAARSATYPAATVVDFCTAVSKGLRPEAAPAGNLQALRRSLSSSPRSATSSASTCRPPEHAIVLCVDKKSRSRRSTAASRCCRCAPASRRAAATTTSAMGRPRCSLRSTSPPAR